MGSGWGRAGLIFFSGGLHFLFEWLMGKPKEDKEEIQELSAPTVEEGGQIPVLFGSRMISAPMIAWFGDTRITKVAVKGKGKKG
jgi:hypothetical protein